MYRVFIKRTSCNRYVRFRSSFRFGQYNQDKRMSRCSANETCNCFVQRIRYERKSFYAFDYFRQPVVYIEHGHIYTRRVHGKLCSRVIVCTRPCGYGAIRPDHRDIGWFGRTWNVTHRVTKICLLAGGQTSWQLIQKHHYRLHAYRQVDWRDRYCNATRRFQRVSMYPSTNVPTHSAYAFPISMYAYIACLRALTFMHITIFPICVRRCAINCWFLISQPSSTISYTISRKASSRLIQTARDCFIKGGRVIRLTRTSIYFDRIIVVESNKRTTY